MQHIGRYAALMQEAHRTGGDQAGLFHRLGDNAVARRQRRRNLPRKDRQWKIPRADAAKHPPPMQG